MNKHPLDSTLSVDDQEVVDFWSKVQLGQPDECWPWMGSCMGSGKYGQYYLGNLKVYAHRAAYVYANGCNIPDGMVIRHSCDNPSCCNPSHLSIGTQGDNMRDRKERGGYRHGAQHHLAKLSEEDVMEIRRRSKTGAKQVELAAIYGVTQSVISRILSGENWSWLE